MKTLLRFILFMLFLNSCIQSDLSDCPTEVRLKFRYTLNTANQDKLTDEVDNISMYVFDENDLFVDHFKYNVDNSQSFVFDLYKGKYNIVALGNLSDHYVISELNPTTTKLSDFVVSLNETRRLYQDSSALFHSFVETIVVDEFGASREVNLRKNSKLVNIRLIYERGRQYTESKEDNLPKVSLTGLNGSFNHKNELIKNKKIVYLPYASANSYFPEVNQNNTDYRFTTLHLEENVPLILSVTGAVEDDFSIDLMDLLKKTPIDLIREDRINISINFTKTASITILINDWKLYLNDGNIGIE